MKEHTVQTMTEHKALREAIEALYAAFERYPLRSHVPGCDHCVFEEDQKRIHAKPLRQLSAEDLDRFSWKALTTWGDDKDLRHFLPRLMECMVDQKRYGPIEPAVLVGKLNYPEPDEFAGTRPWRLWPPAEQQAVKNFLMAWWKFTLAQRVESAKEAIDVLCAIAAAESDLSLYLHAWDSDRRAAALQHLADFVVDEGNKLIHGGSLSNAFWKDEPAQAQVMAWVKNAERLAAMEQAFFDFAHEPFAENISLAVDILRVLTDTRAPGKAT